MLFYCKKHKSQKKDISVYSVGIVGESPVYLHKGKILTCPKCGVNMICDNPDGEFNVYHSTFNSLSQEEKKKIMKKRSKDHNKKYKDHRIQMALDHVKQYKP